MYVKCSQNNKIPNYTKIQYAASPSDYKIAYGPISFSRATLNSNRVSHSTIEMGKASHKAAPL